MGISPRARLVGTKQTFAEGCFFRSRSHAKYWTTKYLHTLPLRPRITLPLKRLICEEKGLLWTASHSNTIEDQIAFRSSRQSSILDSSEEYELDIGSDIGIKASTKSRAVFEVLRVDNAGQHRRIYVKRRDLVRTHGLKPRDLRRIDPFWDRPQWAHSIVIKDSAFLVSLLGLRCLVSEDRMLLFDPENEAARKFLAFVTPRLRTAAGSSMIESLRREQEHITMNGDVVHSQIQSNNQPPFELEILEGILTVALSQLDLELGGLLKRASKVLSAVPSEVNPMNLEEIRKTKQCCVELESKAEALKLTCLLLIRLLQCF